MPMPSDRAASMMIAKRMSLSDTPSPPFEPEPYGVGTPATASQRDASSDGTPNST
jgi:hypothetical protein